MMRMPKRCGECGSKKLALKDTTGPFPWKGYGMIHLVLPMEFPTCDDCGNFMVPASATRKIDDAVRRSISLRAAKYINDILEREHEYNQTTLAARVGKAPEYLSLIKSGAKVPSYSVYALLRVLAKDAKAFKILESEETQEINLKEALG